MSLVNIIDLSYQAGTKPLFEGISFAIESDDRIGLVGHNGCGKSTLIQLLAQSLEPDEGRLHCQRGLSIGFVEQFVPDALLAQSVIDAASAVLPESDRTLRRYQVETVLLQLGFPESRIDLSVDSLSGGQKNLLLFARAILLEPELLLLDEPGNHMDSQAMFYLKRYLQSETVPAFLMISHDRDLLDSVTNRTLWLRDQRCYSFAMPYSDAKLALAEQDEAARKARAAEEKQIDKLKVSAKRLATWGKVYDNEDLARKAKSMEKRIDKLEGEKTFVSKGTGLSLQVDAEFLKTKQVFVLENERVSTPDGRLLFEVEELNFRPGDRIALLGVNGSGKSSCIKALMQNYLLDPGEQTSTRFNPNVRIGYFDQELDNFHERVSILDWVRRNSEATDDTIQRSLIHWGFPYEDHNRFVDVLSGGERARLLLMTFQLNQPNLLIMDEPTNHIDLQGKEELERDLMQPGLSLLFTSHDRHFIEQVATRYWWIHDGCLREIHDASRYFDALSEREDLPAREASGSVGLTASTPDSVGESSDDEQMLERIIELEQLLADDRARKPKFQKPKRQQQWQSELEILTRQLS